MANDQDFVPYIPPEVLQYVEENLLPPIKEQSKGFVSEGHYIYTRAKYEGALELLHKMKVTNAALEEEQEAPLSAFLPTIS